MQSLAIPPTRRVQRIAAGILFALASFTLWKLAATHFGTASSDAVASSARPLLEKAKFLPPHLPVTGDCGSGPGLAVFGRREFPLAEAHDSCALILLG